MPVAGEDARRRQREHPADVLRRYEMPGRPKDVRPKDVAPIEGAIDIRVGERRCAKRQCPLGAGVVLRLDGAEPGDDLDRLFQIRSNELLIQESLADDVEFQV